MHRNPSVDPGELSRLALERGLSIPEPVWHAQLPSTNAQLANLILADPSQWSDFSVLGTDFQSAGQGRLGRGWSAPPGSALTFSTVRWLAADFDRRLLGWIPLVTGWAVADAIGSLGTDAKVKWPNDVLAADRKLCGILCRAVDVPNSGRTAVVIGIGVNTAIAAEELPVDTATSLSVLGVDVSREELLTEILVRLNDGLGDISTDACQPGGRLSRKISESMDTLGRQVRAMLPGDRDLTGRAVRLNEFGDLVIAAADGEQTVTAGDVIHLRPAQ